MAEKKRSENQAAQSKKFLKTVQELIDAGELSPTEAEKQFDSLMERIAASKPPQSK